MCLAQRLETDLRPVGKTDHDVLLLLLFKLLLTCLTYGCVGVCVCVRDAGAGEVQRVLGVFWIPASISSYAAAHHDAVHRSSACFSRRFRWYLSTLTRAQKLWDRRTDPRRRRGEVGGICIQGCYTKQIYTSYTRLFPCQIRCSHISLGSYVCVYQYLIVWLSVCECRSPSLSLSLSPAPVGAFALQQYMDLGTWSNLHHAVQAKLFSAGDPRNMSDVSVPRP
jgi:hypothetical protein